MRFLLIAYDFPPVPSPQSLRWAYMARELVGMGHELHVLTPELPGYGPGGLPPLPPQVRIHRCYPGPLSAFLLLRRRKGTRVPTLGNIQVPDSKQQTAAGAHPVQLNWKGKLAEILKSVLSWFLFPDYRAEWLPWARRATRKLISELRPDYVVTSHEPASSLPLGALAKKQGCRWIADLGDPVLASYTSWRWRWRAARLERQVCRRADLVSVTTEGTASLLQARHGLGRDRCFVSPQGFDQSYQESGQVPLAEFKNDRLELLYTGSFYSFRRAESIIRAVVETNGVRLNIATSKAPDYVAQAAKAHPESVRILGFLPHASVLGLQRKCDVLVSIANADPVQIPGKFNEYLGAGRPIVHISSVEQDAVRVLIEDMKIGWHVRPDHEMIGGFLASLLRRKRLGDDLVPSRDEAAIARYSWIELTRSWAEWASGPITKSDGFPEVSS